MDTKTTLGIGAALIGAAALGVTLAAFSNAQDKTPSPANVSSGQPYAEIETSFSDQQEDEIRALVKNYLLNNPEVIIDSVNEYGRRQQAQAAEQAVNVARESLPELLDPAHGFVAGADPENAKVAVIELFDYHCGFCKRAAPLVKSLINDDKDVSFVFREYPILREESDYAAEAALASRDQGKFLDFHFALMNASGVLTKDRVADIAKKEGIDLAKLEKSRVKPQISAALIDTHEIARDMRIDGTPAFIIASTNGDYINVVQGFRPDEVTASIDEARKAAR